MRIFINERRVKRNRQVAQILFFVSVAILIGGLVVSSGFIPATSTGILFFAPLIVLPIGLTTTLISIRLTNEYVRPPHAEDVIRDGLKGINRRSILYDYVLDANHVLLAPQGVFTMTSRFQETKFKVDHDHWTDFKARGPLGPLFLWLKQENLRKPFKQADIDADTVQNIVDEVLPGAGILVQPVVVFTSEKANLEVIAPEIPVVYANSKKRPSLKALLRDEKKDHADILTDAQIAVLHEKIMASVGGESTLVGTEA